MKIIAWCVDTVQWNSLWNGTCLHNFYTKFICRFLIFETTQLNRNRSVAPNCEILWYKLCDTKFVTQNLWKLIIKDQKFGFRVFVAQNIVHLETILSEIASDSRNILWWESSLRHVLKMSLGFKVWGPKALAVRMPATKIGISRCSF